MVKETRAKDIVEVIDLEHHVLDHIIMAIDQVKVLPGCITRGIGITSTIVQEARCLPGSSVWGTSWHVVRSRCTVLHVFAGVALCCGSRFWSILDSCTWFRSSLQQIGRNMAEHEGPGTHNGSMRTLGFNQ